MKKCVIFLSFLFILLLLFNSSLMAFSPYGTVPQSMGGAYSGVGNDIAAIYYNPASLNPPLLFEFTISPALRADAISLDGLEKLAKMFGGFDLEDFDPEDLKIDPQLLTISGLVGAQANIPIINLSPGILFISDHTLDFNNFQLDYTEKNSFLINARHSLFSPPFDLMAITVGANVKVYTGEKTRFRIAPPDLDEGLDQELLVEENLATGMGYGLDVGLKLKATDILTIGISALDLIHNFSWEYEEEVIDEETSLIIRGGAAIRVPLLAITIAGDVENFSHDGERLNRLHMGAQKGFIFNTIIIRAGAYTQPEKEEEEMVFTAGLGLNFMGARANLSLYSEGEPMSFKGASLSVGYRF